MENWKIDVSPYKPEYIEPLKLIFDQAEKRLRWCLEVSDRITQRSYLIVAALIPLATLLMNVLGRYYILKQMNLEKVVPLCVAAMVGLLVILFFLVQVLFPRLMHQVGAEPRAIGHKMYFDNPDQGVPDTKVGQVVLLANEIQDIQNRIDYTQNQNASRIRKFKLALWVVFAGFACAIAYIAYYASRGGFGFPWVPGCG